MAIVSVTELFAERGGSASLGGKGNEGAVRTYTRVHQVITDDEQDGPQTVMFARGIPRLGEIYKSGNDVDRGAVCVKVDPQAQPGSRIEWKVRSEFTNKGADLGDLKRELGSGKEGQADSGKPGSGANKEKKDSADQHDPEKQAPKFVVSYRPTMRPLVRDFSPDKKLVVNSAKDPFDPPIEYEDLMAIIRVTHMVPVEKFDARNKKVNGVVVNADVVKIPDLGSFPPGTLRQVGVESSFETISGRRMAVISREWWQDDNAAFLTVLDVGFHEIDPATGRRRLIEVPDADGALHQASSPQALRNGVRADVPDELTFQKCPLAPFANMY